MKFVTILLTYFFVWPFTLSPCWLARKKLSYNPIVLQNVSFSMPLCHSKVEEVTAEDLVALSEIEKNNLGKVWNLFIFS